MKMHQSNVLLVRIQKTRREQTVRLRVLHLDLRVRQACLHLLEAAQQELQQEHSEVSTRLVPSKAPLSRKLKRKSAILTPRKTMKRVQRRLSQTRFRRQRIPSVRNYCVTMRTKRRATIRAVQAPCQTSCKTKQGQTGHLVTRLDLLYSQRMSLRSYRAL